MMFSRAKEGAKNAASNQGVALSRGVSLQNEESYVPDIYLLPGADLANHDSAAVFPFLPTADGGYVPRHKSQDEIDSFVPMENI